MYDHDRDSKKKRKQGYHKSEYEIDEIVDYTPALKKSKTKRLQTPLKVGQSTRHTTLATTSGTNALMMRKKEVTSEVNAHSAKHNRRSEERKKREISPVTNNTYESEEELGITRPTKFISNQFHKWIPIPSSPPRPAHYSYSPIRSPVSSPILSSRVKIPHSSFVKRDDIFDESSLVVNVLWLKVVIGGITINTTLELLTSVPDTLLTMVLGVNHTLKTPGSFVEQDQELYKTSQRFTCVEHLLFEGCESHQYCSATCYQNQCNVNLVNFDRDSDLFHCILNYLRTKSLLLDKRINIKALYEEAKFFNILPLVADLEQLIKQEEESVLMKQQEKDFKREWKQRILGNIIKSNKNASSKKSKLSRDDVYDLLLKSSSQDCVRLRGLDLSEIDLSKFDLSRINLGHVNFKGTNLSHVLIDKCDLSDSILENSCLLGAQSKHVVLKNTNIVKCNFSEGNWGESNFEDSKFNFCEFNKMVAVGCDLKKTKFESCSMVHVDLSGSKLFSSCFSCSDLSNVILNDCIIHKVEFIECNLKISFKNSTLVEVSFSGYDLTNCDLTNCTFDRVNFDKCKMNKMKINKIKMDQCSLQGVSLDESKLSKCEFKNCNWNKCNMRRAKFKSCLLPSSQICSADLRSVKLFESDLNNCKIEFTNLTGCVMDQVNLSFSKISNSDFTNNSMTGCEINYVNFEKCVGLDMDVVKKSAKLCPVPVVVC
ncbi:BTB/POZ domain-containing protein [Acrasis kona]|uniref:BTB/POZ domain-containing protein n=1 Tax=Acrasis kona TaxID=1008807 RepID=A0AAW2ZLZ4_9EUKA